VKHVPDLFSRWLDYNSNSLLIVIECFHPIG